MNLPAPPVLLITDRQQARAALDAVVGAAFAAGLRWASLREKDLAIDEQIALAGRLAVLARATGARFTLHGEPAIARRAGVDGVHLSAGGDAVAARAILGDGAWVGVSCHGAAAVAAAEAAGADYVTLSPIFASPSKPGYGPALGVDGLAEVARKNSIPIVALGGVDADRAAGCLAAGAAGVAVMGAIMAAPDPGEATRAIVRAVLP